MLRDKRRLAFYGGTFDPFHCGHLEMARAAEASLQLHRIYFVPARQNPLKADGPIVSDADRLAMIRLGIADQPLFDVWEGELDREGPSYTLESIQHIERVYPNCHLFWIIGYDQLAGLVNWYGIEHLVSKIGFILVRRPGYEMTWPEIPGLTIYPIDNPMVPVSGTEIRDRIRKDLPMEGLVPQAVEDYIRQKRLYR